MIERITCYVVMQKLKIGNYLSVTSWSNIGFRRKGNRFDCTSCEEAPDHEQPGEAELDDQFRPVSQA